MRLSTPGIVIRDYTYESNRILTLLTKEKGVITAFANRANRPRSPLAGSTELLCYSDFVLFRTKENYVVDAADSIRIFFGLRSRYEDLALASYFAQLFGELSPSEEPAEAYLQLLLAALHYLEKEQRPPLLIKAVVELRLLTLAGYMPDLIGCRKCGCYDCEDAPMYFSSQGDLVCHHCLPKDPTGLTLVPAGVLQAMRFIIYSQPQKAFGFTLSSKGITTLAQITETYLLYQLEKTLPTLEFFRSLQVNSKE